MVSNLNQHPAVETAYAAYTNQGFLLREAGLVAELLLANMSREAILHEVVEGDLFQLASVASRKTTLQVLLRRFEGAPPSLLSQLSGSPELRRLTNLYLIFLKHRLLREFVAEVLLDAASRLSYVVTKGDVNVFMVFKRSQVDELERWSEATATKAQSNLVNLCVNAGILEKNAAGLMVQLQNVPAALSSELRAAGRQSFRRLLLDQAVL